MKRKNKVITIFVIGIILSGIILIYNSYALFSTNTIGKSAITIKAGEMNALVKVDGVNTNLLSIPQGQTKTFTVTLENFDQPITGNFLLYYQGVLADQLTFGYVTGIDIPPDESGVIVSQKGKKLTL